MAKRRRLPGKSVLDYSITTEPFGLLGRFFLRGEQLLIDAGLTPRVVDVHELLRVNEMNRASWPPLLPNIDPRVFPSEPGEVIAIICYTREGEAVATMGTRRYDMRHTTMKAETDSMRFYYGPNAEEAAKTIKFEVTAPCALKITGMVSYLAALWVRPDHRHNGATRILPKLTRYFTYSQSPFDFEVFGSLNDISPPNIAISYSVEGLEQGFVHSVNGKVLYRGTIGWVGRAHMLRTLERDVTATEAASNLGEVGRHQKELLMPAMVRHH